LKILFLFLPGKKTTGLYPAPGGGIATFIGRNTHKKMGISTQLRK